MGTKNSKASPVEIAQARIEALRKNIEEINENLQGLLEEGKITKSVFTRKSNDLGSMFYLLDSIKPEKAKKKDTDRRLLELSSLAHKVRTFCISKRYK